MCCFFQAQTIAPQGNLGDVHLFAPVQPVLPAVQTPLWGSGVDAETAVAGLDLTVAPTVPAPVPAPASISVSATAQVETQAPAQIPALVPAQNQPPVPVSAQAAAPASVPIQIPTAVQGLASAPVQAPVSAPGPTFERPKGSSASSDTSSAIGKPKLSVPGLAPVTLPAPVQSAAPAHAPAPVAASVPAPVLQPAGIQTAPSVSECASLATAQQNLESTSASSTLQQESCVEVGMKPKFVHFQYVQTTGCLSNYIQHFYTPLKPASPSETKTTL